MTGTTPADPLPAACPRCGRAMDATALAEPLVHEERRCPRCGLRLDAAPETAPSTSGAAPLPERIAFLGFGLIAGSIARGLRAAAPDARLAAWTPTGRGPAVGAELGIVDRVLASPGDAIRDAGLVVLAGPPLAILAELAELAAPLRAAAAGGATITDVASTKVRILEAATANGIPLVGGHPMAGREASGPEASSAGLFAGRPWAVVPAESAPVSHVKTVEALARALGARPVHMTAEEHDAAVAAISHLPLLLSAALVEAVALSPDDGPSWPAARDLAASGWASMTRLARGDPDMGAGILASNAEPVRVRLLALRRAIDNWLAALDGAAPDGVDAGAIRGRLAAARRALEEVARR